MREFFTYIHYLRGVAILYVISVHARGFASYWASSPDVYRVLDSFTDPSEGNGTTMFLFIGGFLFQHLTHRSFYFGKYLTQKFKVLILPYLIISFPLLWLRVSTGFDSLSLPDGFHDWPLLRQIAHLLLTGSHLPPFWFISTIILFYFSAPLLHALDHRRFYTYVFPPLLLVSLFTFRPEHNADPFLSYVHYIPIYMLGMFTSYFKDKILTDNPRPFAVLLSIYLIMCFAEIAGWITTPRNITFEDVLAGEVVFNVYLFKSVILCYMWLTFFYRLRERQMPVLDRLGSYSFGLFFVHYLFISLSRRFFEWNDIPFDFSIVSYLLYFVVILGLSIGAVYGVKKVTGAYSRYLIGS